MVLIYFPSLLKECNLINILDLNLKLHLMDLNPLSFWKMLQLNMMVTLNIKLLLKLSMLRLDIKLLVIFKIFLTMKCVWESKVVIFVPLMFIVDGVKLPKDVCPVIKNMLSVLLHVLMDGSMKDNLVLEKSMELLKTLPLKLLDSSPQKWLSPKLMLIPLLITKPSSIPQFF